jgi:SAM-dependent methyltransferase
MSISKDQGVTQKTVRLKADRFIAAAVAYLEPLKGKYIYEPIVQDYHRKTEQVDGGYARWLSTALPFLVQQYGLPKQPKILDFGCGTGELTVLMNALGFPATGVDVHDDHLALARLLAEENGLPPSTFVQSQEQGRLPFPDQSFDLVTLFVVLEHLSDDVLKWLLPELRRICKGVIYVLVPNKLQTRDDHTGLRFVPWMPRSLAAWYIQLRGEYYRYAISKEGGWDVYYRSFKRIERQFAQAGLRLELPPDEVIFPPLREAAPIHQVGLTLPILGRQLALRVPLPVRAMGRLGWPGQAFYPYLNLLFVSR